MAVMTATVLTVGTLAAAGKLTREKPRPDDAEVDAGVDAGVDTGVDAERPRHHQHAA